MLSYFSYLNSAFSYLSDNSNEVTKDNFKHKINDLIRKFSKEESDKLFNFAPSHTVFHSFNLKEFERCFKG